MEFKVYRTWEWSNSTKMKFDSLEELLEFTKQKQLEKESVECYFVERRNENVTIMKKLRITESVCELSTTTELDVVAIVPEEGNIITDSRIYGKDKQEIHRFNLRNFKQLIRTGWYELRIAANCTITYNLILQD